MFSSDDVRRWTLGRLSVGLLVVPDLILFVGASAAAAISGGRPFAVVTASWTTLVTVGLMAYATVERQAGWGAAVMTLAAIGSLAAALTLWFGGLPSQWIVVGPFRFRAAKRRAPSRHLLHSVAQLVVFWTTFLIVLPLLLGWIERRWRIEWPAFAADPPVVAGVLTFIGGSCLGIWSCLSMALVGHGTPLPAAMANRLVIVGPYFAGRPLPCERRSIRPLVCSHRRSV